MNSQEKIDLPNITENATKEKGRPPGRGSIMWDVITDLNNGALMPSIAIMQSATPAVGTAVNKYALYKYDAIGRGIRTNWSLMRFLYDGAGIAQQESDALRKLHANIKGKLADGSDYFALHPLTFRIVPDTFLDGVIRVRKDLGKPLNKNEETQVYEEYTQLCLLFGIPRKYIEPNIEAFYKYYDNLMRTGMTYNETVQYLIGDHGYYTPKFPRFLSFLQKPFDRYIDERVRPKTRIVYVGALHPTYRSSVGIKWNDEDEKHYRNICKIISKRAKLIPRFIRTNPIVYLLMLGYTGPSLASIEHLKEAEKKLTNLQ